MRHRLFGLSLETDFPFVSHLAEGGSPPDLTFSCHASGTPEEEAPGALIAYRGSALDGPHEIGLSVYRRSSDDLLRFASGLDFFLRADRIDCRLAPAADPELVEIHLLGTVMAFFLERSGLPALHGSAVVVDGRAVVFVAGHRSAKSSLAAALMQAGYALLTDDLVALEAVAGELRVRPGYPTMRLWPDQAERLVNHWEALPRVHRAVEKRRVFVGEGSGFGHFASAATPLGTVYLPERRDQRATTAIEITSLSPRDALVALLAGAFLPNVGEALGTTAERFERLAAVASAVPFRRLSYPSGFEHLHGVAAAVRNDLESVRSAPVERSAQRPT